MPSPLVKRDTHLDGEEYLVTCQADESFVGPCPPAVVRLSRKEYLEGYLPWLEGKGELRTLIPRLGADQREILMSGIGPEDWDRLFKEPL